MDSNEYFSRFAASRSEARARTVAKEVAAAAAYDAAVQNLLNVAMQALDFGQRHGMPEHLRLRIIRATRIVGETSRECV